MKVEMQQLLSLEGSVALVSGGASGIGRAIAKTFGHAGAVVGILDVDGSAASSMAEELSAVGIRAFSLRCDVRVEEDCRTASREAFALHRRIDILCNNAGVIIRKDIPSLTEEEWDRSLDVNLKGTFLLSKHVLPVMIEQNGGSIINIGSGWGLKGGPQAAAYCASKGGVVNLTRAMAIDHGRQNIRVNCICPGDTDTPMLRHEAGQLGVNVEKFLRESAERPLERIGAPEDIANAALFFASRMSSWVTGSVLTVDGGGLA